MKVGLSPATRWSDPDYAETWDRQAQELANNLVRAAHLDILLRILARERFDWCIDLGCGSGLVAERMLDAFPNLNVIGIDSSPPMLAIARRRLDRFQGRVRLVSADLSNQAEVARLKVPRCGAAIAIQSLHHLDRRQLAALLRWVYQHLAPGATLAVVDPVLIRSAQLYESFRAVTTGSNKLRHPDTYDGYRLGLSERNDRLLALDKYVALIDSAGFATACLDCRGDRVFLIARR